MTSHCQAEALYRNLETRKAVNAALEGQSYDMDTWRVHAQQQAPKERRLGELDRWRTEVTSRPYLYSVCRGKRLEVRG